MQKLQFGFVVPSRQSYIPYRSKDPRNTTHSLEKSKTKNQSSSTSKSKYSNLKTNKNKTTQNRQQCSTKNMGDQEFFMYLANRLQTSLIQNNPLSKEEIMKLLKQEYQGKNDELQRLTVYRDKLCLILQIQDHINLDKSMGDKGKQLIKMDTLRKKYEIDQEIQRIGGKINQQYMDLEKQIQYLDSYQRYLQSFAKNSGTIYNSRKVRNKSQQNQSFQRKKYANFSIADEKSIILNNLKNQTNYFIRQLDESQRYFRSQISSLSKEVKKLRIQIHSKQEKLKILNAKICREHIRNNMRSVSRKRLGSPLYFDIKDDLSYIGEFFVDEMGQNILQISQVFVHLWKICKKGAQQIEGLKICEKNLSNRGLKKIVKKYKIADTKGDQFTEKILPLNVHLRRLELYFDKDHIFVGISGRYLQNISSNQSLNTFGEKVICIGDCTQKKGNIHIYDCSQKIIKCLIPIYDQTRTEVLGIRIYFERKQPSMRQRKGLMRRFSQKSLNLRNSSNSNQRNSSSKSSKSIKDEKRKNIIENISQRKQRLNPHQSKKFIIEKQYCIE